MVKLSLLSPTYNRQAFLPLLAETIAKQTAADFEWLVLDDSPLRTTLEGKNLTYIHMKGRMTLGEKRNILAERASGEILVHIDDDDYYGPQYAMTMAQTVHPPVFRLLLRVHKRPVEKNQIPGDRRLRRSSVHSPSNSTAQIGRA